MASICCIAEMPFMCLLDGMFLANFIFNFNFTASECNCDQHLSLRALHTSVFLVRCYVPYHKPIFASIFMRSCINPFPLSFVFLCPYSMHHFSHDACVFALGSWFVVLWLCHSEEKEREKKISSHNCLKCLIRYGCSYVILNGMNESMNEYRQSFKHKHEHKSTYANGRAH